MREVERLPVFEVDLGEWLLRLDDTVFELFHPIAEAKRIHIRHLAVEAKPRRDGGLRLTIGQDVGGSVTGTRVDVDPGRQDEVMAFFAESRRRRDAVFG